MEKRKESVALGNGFVAFTMRRVSGIEVSWQFCERNGVWWWKVCCVWLLACLGYHSISKVYLEQKIERLSLYKSGIEGVFSFLNYVRVSEFSFVVPPNRGNAFSFLPLFALTFIEVSGFFSFEKLYFLTICLLFFPYLQP